MLEYRCLKLEVSLGEIYTLDIEEEDRKNCLLGQGKAFKKESKRAYLT